ncbi:MULTISPECIES: hypothetical protein [Vibrio]|uniref:Porin family protein n=1 Tax=Vibrio casei TaxID=673372 RepID=A0A368LMQ2_9VIBR|nr:MULTISPECIES: hypothetical protein [Vibrio]RCS73118.1 hypothetical protein CIK83_05520 [Vibrio casei]SJN40918.1 hypothetical protein FM109_17625 [Vibrio casei]HBV75523.1 hypothetical protein [Vibrio sp.]
MHKSLVFTGLLLASSSVFAADNTNPSTMSNFNYDYIDARIGLSPMTFGAGVSKSIHPNAHAILSLDSEFDNDYDLSAGLGFHAPVNNWADITGEMLFKMVDDDSKKYNNDAGMEVNIGVRQWLGPQFEIAGKLGYYKINNDADTDDVYGTISGRFHATELFSIGLEGKLNYIYGDQLMVTTRFNF